MEYYSAGETEWITDPWYNMDESQNNYAEWQPPPPKQCLLYDSFYIKS